MLFQSMLFVVKLVNYYTVKEKSEEKCIVEKLIFVRSFCGFLCSRGVSKAHKWSCCGGSGKED